MPRTAPAKRKSLSEQRQQAATEQLRNYHATGLQIEAIRQERQCDGRAAIRLAKSVLSETAAYKAWRFAQQADQAELQLMLEPSQGTPLTCAHADALLSVKKKSRRLKLIRQATREGWSSAELRCEMGVTNAARSLSGRKFHLPADRDGICRGLRAHLPQPLRYVGLLVQSAQDGKLAMSDADRKVLGELQKKITAVLTHFQPLSQQK